MTLDPNGYQLIEKEFTFKTHKYNFMEDLGDNWHIYCQTDKLSGKIYSYELVKLKKQEEYQMAGVTIPKKWTYPSAEMWGARGYTFKTVKECYTKFDELQRENISNAKKKGSGNA